MDRHTKYNEYYRYEVEDFVEDTRFIRWELNPTPEEDQFWNEVMKQNPHLGLKIEKAKEYIFLLSVDEKGLTEDKKRKIWDRIMIASHRKHSLKKRRITVAGYAAVILMLVGIGGLYYFLLQRNDNYSYSINLGNKNEISIILSNGEAIDYKSNRVCIIQEKNGELIVNSDTLKNKKSPKIVSSTSLCHIIVPEKKRGEIVLADGTKVILNSGSKLSFPERFNERRRELYLVGEAFFKVASNKARPFIVHTKTMNVIATGTRFNINSYPEKSDSYTVLVDGVVEIDTRAILGRNSTLKPGEAAFYNETTKKLLVREVNEAPYISWLKGYLLCEKKPIRQLFRELEEYYNQRIICSPGVGQYFFSGKLDLREDMDKVLMVVSATLNIKVTKEDNQFLVHSK